MIKKDKRLTPKLRKEFEQFIRDEHPDPDTLVESTDRWLWLYWKMKIEKLDCFKKGFAAARHSIDYSYRSAMENIEKQLDELTKRNEK